MVRRFVGFTCVIGALALLLAGPALAAAQTPARHVAHAKVVHRPSRAAQQRKLAAARRRRAARDATVAHRANTSAAPAAVAAPAPVPAPAPAPASAPAAAPTSCADGDLIPTSANLDRIRAATVCLVNLQRAANGIGPLTELPDLDAAAQGHTEDMIARDYFDHVGPTGVGLLDRVLATGYGLGGLLGLAENIAAGGGSLATPSATVAAWMDSPDHRVNILDPTSRDTGLGVVAALPPSLGLGAVGATYTEDFGATT